MISVLAGLSLALLVIFIGIVFVRHLKGKK